MKKSAWRFILLSLSIAMIAGTCSVCAEAQSIPVAAQLGWVVDIQPRQPPGKLTVLQRRGEDPKPGKIGMPIRRSYLLMLAPGAKAIIHCAGKDEPIELKLPSQPSPCSPPSPLDTGGRSVRMPGADTANSPFPIIISPRGTELLTDRPTLRWSPVSNTVDAGTDNPETSYTVSIHRNGKLVWDQPGVKANELAYPANQPPLTPGVYLVVVSSNRDTSSDLEQVANRGFVVLPKCPQRADHQPCKEATIRGKEQRIRDLKLPEDSTRLLIGELYAHNGLFAEAIEQFEAARQILDIPVVLRRIADCYADVGLNREASKLYLEALDLPQSDADLETRGLILWSLASAYDQLGEFDKAPLRYDQAIETYLKLDDQDAVKELRKLRSQ